MNTNLETAIYGKLSGSTLTGLIGGRMYNTVAPDKAEYPYVVFNVYVNYHTRAFQRDYSNYRVQFSSFSLSRSLTEINSISAAILSLYDDQPITITGQTTILMAVDTENQITEEHDTPSGTEEVTHTIQEFNVMTITS